MFDRDQAGSVVTGADGAAAAGSIGAPSVRPPPFSSTRNRLRTLRRRGDGASESSPPSGALVAADVCR